MKNLIFLLFSLVLFSGCVKQEPIPQSALTGIWKLNGYQSTSYQVEITADGFLYWWNYNDIFNNVEEFEYEYDINSNRVSLYRVNGTRTIRQFRVFESRNGRLYFSTAVNGFNDLGEQTTRTDTYYLMN